MKYTWAITAIRLGLSVVLLYFAYRETGIATTIILGAFCLDVERRQINRIRVVKAINNWRKRYD